MGVYTGRVLKGEKPADLSVQQAQEIFCRGDTIGITVLSPLILRFWYLRCQLTSTRIKSVLLEATVYVPLIMAALWVILDTRSQHGSNFFYLLFLPVIIAAVRQGFDGACFSLLVTQIGLVFLLQCYNFDAETFTEFHTLMFTLTATGLSVGAIVSERDQVRRAPQDAEERFKKRESQAFRTGRFSSGERAPSVEPDLNRPDAEPATQVPMPTLSLKPAAGSTYAAMAGNPNSNPRRSSVIVQPSTLLHDAMLRLRKSRISGPISSALSSSAKCPVSIR